MTDYELIEAHIRRARLQRSVYLGELISDGVAVAWSAVRRLASRAGKIPTLAQPATTYYTPIVRRF